MSLNVFGWPIFYSMATRFGWRGLRALAFDAKFKSGQWSFATEHPGVIAIVQRWLPASGTITLMGSGSATILNSIQCARAIAVDISTAALELAAKRRVVPETIKAGMEEYIPPPSNVILFSESIMYVPVEKVGPLLTRLRQSLSPQGVFVATFYDQVKYSDYVSLIRKNFTIVADETVEGRTILAFQ